MSTIQFIMQIILGKNISTKIKRIISMLKNYFIDMLMFKKHSSVFKLNNYNKIESTIILKYHSLEKGLIHNNIRPRFGKTRITDLINLLKRKEILENKYKTQIIAAYQVLIDYYEHHLKIGTDISDYYPQKEYDFFKKNINLKINSVKYHTINSYFKNCNKNFYQFSNSRNSVRDYTGEKVPFNVIEKVIQLTKNAPSVCNRQPAKAYFIENKIIIDKIFEIQGGLKGYSDEVCQLFVVTCNRNYFYLIGERNQLFIDGGIFVMNLLYALHYYKIAACPAHWGLNSKDDKKIKKLLNMLPSEKVICLIAIGIPKDNFKTTLSLRRSLDEILVKID